MPEDDVCRVTCVHEDKVNQINRDIEKQDTMSVAKIFKALSDDTRIKIAYALSIENELCVCDVSNIVNCTVATASHHLRLLRNMGLAKYRKEGKLVYYSLDDDHVRKIIQTAFSHIEEGKHLDTATKS
ncbi:metalloregulator ArsR/SmtB family transcription factor [Alkalihalobacillus sp. AL-G]|uniref:ArsR/SmtB family transcription factor n=1 Tax=Alkalihalobacillus sp. AL-G TaxID=2926399 RepID=UPI002729925A|nr:metalloregulator ArsR/SmtB family transcription factor [Alkalihalobacillus sp. AL-G]WLD93626.1 metalloregulator ArsR/SmtB family transcription factor [Alkalihalobacillus sp. AL-G]